MEDWLEYQSEREAEDRQRAERLWRELEQGNEQLAPELLRGLSGLLDRDVDDLRQRWGELRLDVRRSVARALLAMADDDFKLDFSAVFRVALHDPDAEIRAASALGLREIEDVRLVPVLSDMLRRDPEPAAREAAAAALGDYVLLGELGKIRPEPFEAALKALTEAYLNRSEDAGVRRQAIEAVAYTAEMDVADLIRDAYDAAQEAMRISAVIAMGRSADTRWGRTIQRELSNTNPTMRLEATRAAGELQLRDAAREVATLTDDVDQNVRLMAVWALGQMGGPVARKTLTAFAASDEDPELQPAAQEALQELEFFHGDSASFFGPPSDFSGDAEEPWELEDLLAEDEDADDEDEDDEDDDWD